MTNINVKEANMKVSISSKTVQSITQHNPPIAGCTVSKCLLNQQSALATVFSLAKNTNISAEIYPQPKIIWVLQGQLEIFEKAPGSPVARLSSGDCAVTFANTPTGFSAGNSDAIYIEFEIGRQFMMNKAINGGEIFKLADILPYSEGRVVSMDLVDDKNVKFVVMSFDAGTGLSEHAAPGEALIFGLDGEGLISYEGKQHILQAGDCFKFEKGGIHSVRADKKFKMALFLPL